MNRSLFAVLGALIVLSIVLAACSPPATEQAEDNAAPTDPSPTVASGPTIAAAPTEDVQKASPSPETLAPAPDYEIVTLLPRDGIPAIFDPEFLTADEANEEYNDNELVLGVEIDGDARAYSIPHLSSHEIVNDTVGGRHIAATW